MASRSLNRVQLIGNLTRDPELRYTPQGTAVCTFSLATNRGWVTEGGEKKEETEFHRVVAWNKLAEICAQFLSKGRKVFAEGRLQTRQWTTQDGSPRQTTEIVISEMIILDPRRKERELSEDVSVSAPEEFPVESGKEDISRAGKVSKGKTSSPQVSEPVNEKKKKTGDKKAAKEEGEPEQKEDKEAVSEDDIPF
ncbi:MAG TPA: single-stranded DNA-binding protein [Candidatus Bathyarchaeia archaeon]|nr:single-stranded DNA-binding protein [Candidatus Bathyarchaeia archaeon]